MIVFLNDRGEIITSAPTTVGRNSANAAEIVVVAPADSALANAVIYAAFSLPNGVELWGGLGEGNQPIPADVLPIYSPEAEAPAFKAWRIPVGTQVTSISGTVGYTVYAVTESMRTSASGTFQVERGTVITTPSELPTEGAWEQIVSKINTLASNLSELADEVAGIAADVGDKPTDGYTGAETLWGSVVDLYAAYAEAEERITTNEGSIASLSANVGERPVGYSTAESLWGAIGNRPPANGRQTVWEAVRGLDDRFLSVADSLNAADGRIDAFGHRLDAFGAKLENLDAANKGLSYIERSAREVARKFAFPANSLPFATLDKLGGVCSNVELTPVSVGLHYTPGVSCAFGSEISLSGQSTDGGYLEVLWIDDVDIAKEIVLDFVPISGASTGNMRITYAIDLNEVFDPSTPHTFRFTPNFSGDSVRLQLYAGSTFDSFVFALNVVNVGTEIKECAVTELYRAPVNLLPEYFGKTAPLSKNGLYVAVLEDGGIHVNGTPSANTDIMLTYADGVQQGFPLPAGTYSKSPDFSNAIGKGLVVKYSQNGGTSSYWQTGTRTFDSDVTAYPYLRFLAGVDIDEVFYPIVAAGPVIPKYEKPGQSYSFPIPKGVQNLAGYGIGIDGNVCNRIEFSNDEDGALRAEFVQHVAISCFVGSEADWSISSIDATINKFSFARQGLTPASKLSGAMMSTRFEASRAGGAYTAVIDGDGSLCFFVPKSVANSLAAWRALLAGWNDESAPLTVLYERETPVATNVIDQMPDNFIATKGANPYTIQFVNSNDLPAAFEIAYDVTTGG